MEESDGGLLTKRQLERKRQADIKMERKHQKRGETQCLCTNRDQRGREMSAIPEGAFGSDPTSVPSMPALLTRRLETNIAMTP